MNFTEEVDCRASKGTLPKPPQMVDLGEHRRGRNHDPAQPQETEKCLRLKYLPLQWAEDPQQGKSMLADLSEGTYGLQVSSITMGRGLHAPSQHNRYGACPCVCADHVPDGGQQRHGSALAT